MQNSSHIVMEKSTLLHLLIFPCLIFQCLSMDPNTFIHNSCKATLYPPLCFQSLSSYANSIQQNSQKLAETALTVTLARAGSAAKFILQMTKTAGLKPREYGALRDCAVNMGVTVAQLKRSIAELSQASQNINTPKRSFSWRVGNVQTWVSTAITNGNICLFGFDGLDGKVKAAVSPKVTNVVQLSSNALAFVNNYAANKPHPQTTNNNFP